MVELERFRVPVMFDILARVLPTGVYLDLLEKFDPRVPLVDTAQEILKGLNSRTELKQIDANINAYAENIKVVQETIAKMK